MSTARRKPTVQSVARDLAALSDTDAALVLLSRFPGTGRPVKDAIKISVRVPLVAGGDAVGSSPPRARREMRTSKDPYGIGGVT